MAIYQVKYTLKKGVQPTAQAVSPMDYVVADNFHEAYNEACKGENDVIELYSLNFQVDGKIVVVPTVTAVPTETLAAQEVVNG